jgi:acetyl esterase
MTSLARRPLDPAIEQLLDDIDPDAPGLDELPIEETRATVARMVEWMGPVVGVGSVEDADADGVPVRIYRSGPGPLVLLTHGGGWLSGSIEISDRPSRLLANACGGTLVSVEYRLAPEHPFPAGLDDAYTALRWTAAHAGELGADPGFLAVAGDSAGGNLAAALALLARDRGGPAIAHQLLMFPVLDNDFESDSYREFGDGYFLTRAAMEHFWRCYVGDCEPPEYAAPLRAATLAGLPPATILQAAADPLFSEGAAYAARLAAERVPVAATVFEGLVHGALWMTGLSAHTRAFAEYAGAALRAAHTAARG